MRKAGRACFSVVWKAAMKIIIEERITLKTLKTTESTTGKDMWNKRIITDNIKSIIKIEFEQIITIRVFSVTRIPFHSIPCYKNIGKCRILTGGL